MRVAWLSRTASSIGCQRRLLLDEQKVVVAFDRHPIRSFKALRTR